MGERILVKKLETVTKIGDGSWDTFMKNGFYSRAGFYLDKPFFKTVTGCNAKGKRAKGRNLTFLNFFANGDSPLCCQDWNRVTSMGNVKDQSILEIMNSEKWFDIRSKTLGKPSDDNFICKWCEVAEGIPY